VPQGKKMSPVYDYFVCEYRTDGGAVIYSTRYICVHKDHNGHPVRVAHCKVTANLEQHLFGKHGVVVSSTHLGGRAAGEFSSGSGGVRPAVANTVNIRLCTTLAHFCVSVLTLSVTDTFSIPRFLTNELPSGIVRAA